MKIIGGPRDGQQISISEEPGGPELNVEGMIIEYVFSEPGRINVRFYADPDPKPSFPGFVERYKCHNGAWLYIPPVGGGFSASPPLPVE